MKKVLKLLCVAVLLVSLMLASAGCSNKDKVVLNVFNWGEYIDESVLADFEKEYNTKVNYEQYDTNEDMYLKVKAGGTKYDVIFPSDYMIEKMIKEDMLYKIDMNNITNYKYIDERFKNLAFDSKNEYSVPYFWGTLGILYNTKIVTEPVDSWDILWDEKYKGEIVMLDSQRDTIGVALKKLGYSINSNNKDEIEKAKELLIQQRPLVLAYTVDQIKDMMIGEEAVLALDWSGDAIEVLDENENIGYAVPKEGSNLWFDAMVIPKSSEHKKEAELFIDFMTRPEIAFKNTDYVGYATTNTETFKMVDSEISGRDSYYPSDEIINNCEVFVDLGDFKDVYGDVWTAVKAQ